MNDSTRAHTRYARLLAAFLTAAVALISAPVLAGTPVQVPVQGLLTDTDGEPVDGATSVTFRIYPDATATEVLWESQTSLTVDRGLFDTALGADNELDSDIFSAHPDVHLTINIEGDEESARMRLGTVPTAAHALTANSAEEAQTLQGQTPDDLIGDLSAGDVAFDDSQAQLGADNTQAALEALLARVEALEQDKQDLQTQVDANDTAIGSLDTRVGDVESDTSGLQAQIDANETGLQSLQSTVSANSSDISSLQTTTSSNSSDIASLQTTTSANTSDISSLQSTTSSNSSDIASLQTTTSANTSDISSLQAKTANMSATTINGHDAITFDSVNVYVRNGTGSTSGTADGTGNLIVGYDEARSTGSDKTGSHNLILGRYHNYSSYGGIVAGDRNESSADNASVIGGTRNIASYTTAVVVGGYGNEASGFRSAVVSGWQNTASGSYSAVLGGYNNEASATQSSVGGGDQLTNSSYNEFRAEGSVTAR